MPTKGDMRTIRTTLFILIFCIALVCPAVADQSETADDQDGDDESESPQEEPAKDPLPVVKNPGSCITGEGITESELETMRNFCKEYAQEKQKREESLANQKKNRLPPEVLEVRTIFDNDIFINNVSGGDRGYTNGMRIEALGQIPTEIDTTFYRFAGPNQKPGSWLVPAACRLG